MPGSLVALSLSLGLGGAWEGRRGCPPTWRNLREVWLELLGLSGGEVGGGGLKLGAGSELRAALRGDRLGELLTGLSC